jgi:hypothetical protein
MVLRMRCGCLWWPCRLDLLRLECLLSVIHRLKLAAVVKGKVA